MKQHRTISLVFLWQLAASICYYAVFAATPFFRDEFGLTGTTVGFAVTMLTLGYAVFLLPFGAITDRYGERRILTAGLIGLAGGSLLVSFAGSYMMLLAGVFVLGSLYGTAMPGTNKAIFGNISVDRQNLATGIKQVGVTAGSGLSAVLLTNVAEIAFWEVGFYLAAAIALGVAIVFAISYTPSNEDRTTEFPSFRVLFRNRPYRSLCIAGWFLGAALFTTVGYTIIYLNESLGLSVVVSGLVLAGLQVSGSVGRIVTGWLSDTLPGEPRRRIGKILAVQAVGSTVLFGGVAFVEQRLAAIVVFVALGFFILGFTGVYYSCLATLVPNTKMGGATAGGQLALTSGALLAPPTFGFIAERFGYRMSWLLLAGLSFLSLLFVVRVIVTPPPKTSQSSKTTCTSPCDD
ncbi:MFS transporter [Halostagnicola kamekurae]|uniref:Sugar phosphate permease n=1 Tax=Halostagnicola kamekurae TaxID=619731 RepID=A0A1I6V0T9_9EURY|nr:MFS transporter [Halostagnicola kamekurae]SFT07288.1 Sugar phosphate permease [Halostagnicola kamekurae]